MCSASGYYAWLSRSPPTRERADRALRDRIVDTHSRSRGTYGAPAYTPSWQPTVWRSAANG